MRTRRRTHRQEQNLFVGDDGWPEEIEEVMARDPAMAESFSGMLFAILDALKRGPKGIEEARYSLAAAIEWGYLHTEHHRLALSLYMRHLDGRLSSNDEPLKLIGDALERSAEYQRTAPTRIRKIRRRLSKRGRIR